MRSTSHWQGQRHTQDTTLVNDDHSAYAGPLPPFIPHPQPDRRLVLCFDGTGDQFDDDNSNIVQLVRVLKKDDNTKQLVYYQAGIGTYTSPVFVTEIMTDLSQTLDAAVAWNIHSHVIDGYEFLVQNYRPGDKICIFGFSRGAYIARSLASMVHRVGIIPVDNHQQIPFAYKIYTSDNWKLINGFKVTFSVDVDIEFVGVWDTVDSVGIFPKYFPLMASNTGMKTFRHAIALDEHRSKFNVNLWNRLPDGVHDRGVDTRLDRIKHLRELKIIGDEPPSPLDGDIVEHKLSTPYDRTLDCVQVVASNRNVKRTDVEEVWFAGCHCDVGGGSVVNKTRYSLARIPLRWMIRECFKANTGILFDTAFLYTIGLDPAPLYRGFCERPGPAPSDSLIAEARKRFIKERESTPSRWFSRLFKKKQVPLEKKDDIPPFISEDDEDLEDALSPMYDQMKINRLWWILEFLPVKMRYQKEQDEKDEKDEKDIKDKKDIKDSEWVSCITINRGKGRVIRNQEKRVLKVHRSVKLRMEARPFEKGKKYKPKATNFNASTCMWI